MLLVKAILVAALVVFLSRQVWSASLIMGNRTPAASKNISPENSPDEVETNQIDKPDNAQSSKNEEESPNDNMLIYKKPFIDEESTTPSNDVLSEKPIDETKNQIEEIINLPYGEGVSVIDNSVDSKDTNPPPTSRQKRSTGPRLAAIVTKLNPSKGKEW